MIVGSAHQYSQSTFRRLKTLLLNLRTEYYQLNTSMWYSYELRRRTVNGLEGETDFHPSCRDNPQLGQSSLSLLSLVLLFTALL